MASVVISVDAELGSDTPPFGSARRRARRSWLRLVDCFERYGIPATWAIVGRLFTDEDAMDFAPDRDWIRSDTYGTGDRDPTAAVADLRRTTTLSGHSLVEAVLESGPDHDVGSHSYSHPRFPDITREFAVADLTATTDAMADWNLDPVSFVYPFNAVAHRDVLAETGFTCYRGTPGGGTDEVRTATWRDAFLDRVPEGPKWWAGWTADRASEAVAYTVGREPPELIEPRVDDCGLVAVPASMPSLYRMPVRLRTAIRSTGRYPLARIAKIGVDSAAETDGIFHLWFHPGDFHTDGDFESFERVLEHLADERDDGAVRVETMADVAARVGG